MQPIEWKAGVEVVPLTSTSNQSRERETSKRNNKLGLRHNKKHIKDKRSYSSSVTLSSNQAIETEANIEATPLTTTQGRHFNNISNTANHTNKTTNSKKQRRQSNGASTPLRKKITWKMSMAFLSSRSNSGLERVDISGFQLQEREKTAVRKNLKWHATFLFFLAVVATGIVLLDTQIKVQWEKQRAFLDSMDLVVSQNTTEQRHTQLQTELDKLDTYKNTGIGLKAMLSAVSILTCISLLYYYRNLFRMKKVRHFFPQKMSFVRATPLMKKYLIECAICLFHVPPYLDLYVEIPNEVQIFVLLRLYLLGRFLKEKHELMNSQSTRFLASVTKTELTSMFLFKTFFMQYPFQMILLAYIILLFIGGYGVWMIENQYTYLDTVWMLIITMTTVGFGDLTPKTMMGRFCVGITAIVGIFLMALFISLVNEALMLQRREKRILAYVENQDLTRHRKVTALNAIGMWYKYYSHMNRYFRNTENVEEATSFIGTPQRQNDPGHRTTRQDLMNKIKGKLLETEMFYAVNEWRKIKNARGGNYFSQEFMIEDMKNMMSDLNGKFDELDEKVDNVSADLKSICGEEKNGKEERELNEKNQRLSSYTCQCQTNMIHSKSNGDIPNKSNTSQQNDISIHLSDVNRPQQQAQMKNKINNTILQEPNRTTHSNNADNLSRFITSSRKNIQDMLQEQLQQYTNAGSEDQENPQNQGIKRTELVVAFKLLKNQAQIMNSALDEVYHKTRQDICDLENLINSLLVCADGENGETLDFVPSKEVPV